MSMSNNVANIGVDTPASVVPAQSSKGNVKCPGCCSEDFRIIELGWIYRCMGCHEPFRYPPETRDPEDEAFPVCPYCRGGNLDYANVWLLCECRRCDGLFGVCTRNEVSAHVILRWDRDGEACGSERYFDFMLLDAKGIDRVHGWYNPETKRVVQFG